MGLNYIWPMSIIMKAFTTDAPEEIRSCLKQLRDTDGGTGFMHESFNSENAADFTRSWFAWTNTLFGELILKIIREYPGPFIPSIMKMAYWLLTVSFALFQYGDEVEIY